MDKVAKYETKLAAARDERNAEILRLRREQWSLAKIARLWGISRERVRQIEAEATEAAKQARGA